MPLPCSSKHFHPPHLKVVIDALLKVVYVDGVDAGGEACLELLQALEGLAKVVQLKETLRQPIIPDDVGRVQVQRRIEVPQCCVTVSVVAPHQVMGRPSVQQLGIVGTRVDLLCQLRDQGSTRAVAVAGSQVKVKELAHALLASTAAVAAAPTRPPPRTAATATARPVVHLCAVVATSATAAATTTTTAAPVLVVPLQGGSRRELQPVGLFALVQVVQVDLLRAHVHQQLPAVGAEGEVRDRLARVLRVLAQVARAEVRDALPRDQVHRAGVARRRREILRRAVRELKWGRAETDNRAR